MAKPVAYRVVSFKNDIIILKRMTKTSGKSKNKRMTVEQLAVIVQEGFRSVNARLDQHEARMDKHWGVGN